MKKIVKILDIDCANCAHKFESAILNIEGVIFVSINFLTEKMELDIEDDKYEQVVAQIKKLKKKMEPDAEIIGL